MDYKFVNKAGEYPRFFVKTTAGINVRGNAGCPKVELHYSLEKEKEYESMVRIFALMRVKGVVPEVYAFPYTQIGCFVFQLRLGAVTINQLLQIFPDHPQMLKSFVLGTHLVVGNCCTILDGEKDALKNRIAENGSISFSLSTWKGMDGNELESIEVKKLGDKCPKTLTSDLNLIVD